MHGRISPRRTRNPCDYTMKISSRFHRLLIYDVKRNTNIDSMGPFNLEQKWWPPGPLLPDRWCIQNWLLPLLGDIILICTLSYFMVLCLTQDKVNIMLDTNFLFAHPKFTFSFLLLRHSAFVPSMAVLEKRVHLCDQMF